MRRYFEPMTAVRTPSSPDKAFSKGLQALCRRRSRTTIAVTLMVFVLANEGARGNGWDRTAESYSALECLQRVADELHRPVDMLALLSSPLLQLQQDDTSSQIVDLARQQKLNAVILDHLRTDQIMRCPCPLLIHVMGGRYSTKPDYYVLYHGVRDGQAQIFSPSIGELSIPLNQLEADRRGESVAVSDQTISPDVLDNRSLTDVRFVWMGGVALALAAIALIRHIKRPTLDTELGALSELRASMAEFSRLAVFAIALAFGSRFASAEPLLPPQPAAPQDPVDFLLPHSPQPARPQAQPPELSLEAAVGLVNTNALFVDARDVGEYGAGHIRGAIVCPASDIARWHLHMAGVDPHRQIIVYCAEASCRKGEYVARFLLQHGFTDVSLYRDGWAKWTGPKERE